MLERLSPVKRNLALAGIAVLVLWFAWTVRTVLNPLILGYLLAYIVHPLVLKLERRGWRRGRAVSLIYVTGFVTILLVSVVVFQQSRSLVRAATRASGTEGSAESRSIVGNAIARIEVFVEEHQSWLAWMIPEEPPAPAEGAPAEHPVPVPDGGAALPAGETAGAAGPVGAETTQPQEEPFDLETLLGALWDRLSQEGDGGARTVAVRGAAGVWSLAQRLFGSLMAVVTMVLLLPIYSYFLLFELDNIHGFVRRYLPRRERDRIIRIGTQIGEVLANFFRGRLLICLLKGAFLTVGLLIAGVDYAFLLGMASGMLALVPFLGPLIGFLFATAVALINPEFGVVSAMLRTGIVFAAAEIVEGYLLVPKILGDSLGLHPIVVVVSVFVGGAALGMFGVLLALPLTAALVILARELVLPALEDFAEEN
jgi:predicted PurR-regulated permease PerM